MVLPASYSITAGPVAVGSTANTAVTNSRSTAVSSGSPLGRTCTRAWPSGATQSRFSSAGRLSSVTGCGLERCCSPSSETRSGVDERRRGPLPGRRVGLRQAAAAARRAASPHRRPCPGSVAGELRQRCRPSTASPRRSPVARRRLRLARHRATGRAWPPSGRCSCELFVLVGGNEAAERLRRATLRGRAPAAATSFVGLGEVRRHDLDRVGAGLRIAPQFEEGGDRFGLAALQMQRIEVERQPVAAAARRARRPRASRRRPPMRLRSRKRSTGASQANPIGARLAGRVQHRQQRRQQGDAGQEGDDHAEPAISPEFGQPAIGGRQEGR